MSDNFTYLEGATKGVLKAIFNDSTPSYQQIKDELNKLREIYPVSEKEYNRILKSISSKLIHQIGNATILKGQNSEHFPWYEKSKIDNLFWRRYYEYLSHEKNWSNDILKSINETSDKVMENLGNPKSSQPFQRRGLILGDVQSGKTANYTAICNKAIDSGYKIIIVLAGMMENLRIQTQERLDTELVGRTSKYILDKNLNHKIQEDFIGVGKIDLEEGKTLQPITCFTSVTTDFKLSTIKAVKLSIRNLKGTALFVVKKNKSILTNLHSWLKSNNSNLVSGLIDLPTLVIDDESDNASINTNLDDQDPTAINNAIRNILHLFTKASYVGITATPFANIFINPDENDTIAQDLFPKDFITLLPTPERYIGAEKIFGKGNIDSWGDDYLNGKSYLGEYNEALVSIVNEEQAQYFAYKHKKEIANHLYDLPESLLEAIRYFILICAISDYRLDEKEHRSMLVNVSRFTDVQNVISDIIDSKIIDIKYSIESYSYLDLKRSMNIEEIQELFKVWDKYKLEEKVDINWDNLLKKYLQNSVQKIKVSAINQKHGSKALDYDKYKDYGKRLIAVGGNSLSRGITLEGLCVTYFYRNTMMYDTLLQMGRWFGYRDNYEDLFKIWMGEDSIDWYGYISDAVNELKDEIKKMERQNSTPSDFGLRVRQAPCSLIVTARNKMRHSFPFNRPISVSGKLIETPRLFSQKEILKMNEISCKDFLSKIELSNDSKYDEYTNSYIWKNIPKKEIIELLNSFKSHPWNLNFQSSALANYIQDDSKKLNLWDIGIPFGHSKNIYKIQLPNKNIEIKPECRNISKDDSIKEMLKVNGHHVRVGTGGCSRIGLSKSEIDNIRDGVQNKRLPDSAYLIEGRHPIMLIHILENNNVANNEIPKFVFALSLGFPGGEETKTANYVVNTKELESYFDIEEVFDDEDY